MKVFVGSVLLWLLGGITHGEGGPIIDTMRHDIFVVTNRNFDAQINKHRTNGVASVLFFDGNDDGVAEGWINGGYNDFAKNVRGMVKVTGIDCKAAADFCKKEGVVELPKILIYPPMPFPAFPFEGEVNSKSLESVTLNRIPGSHVKVLAQEDKQIITAFLSTNVSVPKVLLFSNKDKSPTIFNALANSFHDRMSFGFVNEKQDSLVKRYQIKSFPTLIVLKGEIAPGKTGEFYKGALKFEPLHEWLNVRSETFVKGGGYQSEDTVEEIKPWLIQKIPEITGASHQDVCFRHKVLCVIFVGVPTEAELEMLEDRHDHHTASSGNVKFKFSWINPAVETAFAALVGVTADTPTLVVVNPHKRLRFLRYESSGRPSAATVDAVVEKITGGDARFTNVKGQKLPPFAAREVPQPNKKDEL